MYFYVLFVRTGQEYKVEQLLKERLERDLFVPFIPLHEKIFKAYGNVRKEIKPLFPSYVFIETDVSSREFIERISNLVYASPDILRVLKYSDMEYAMKESERQMLLNLCNDNRCIESSTGIIEGDKIIIVEGPLKGLESIVKKINRHKRQALIEINFMGEIRLVSVTLEIAEKL